MSSYGRGGLAGDSIRAEAQDFGGRNNANMFTPADGARPRMQVYVFDGLVAASLTATGGVSGTFETGFAQFGPRNFNVTARVSLVTPADACAPATGTRTDKIAFIYRGTCDFKIKVKNAQLAARVESKSI
jgi:large repetitive protein